MGPAVPGLAWSMIDCRCVDTIHMQDRWVDKVGMAGEIVKVGMGPPRWGEGLGGNMVGGLLGAYLAGDEPPIPWSIRGI